MPAPATRPRTRHARGRAARLLALALALPLSLSLPLAALAPGSAGARPLDEVTASGTLRVAVYGDNAPFSDEAVSGISGVGTSGAGAGAPRGIDVDLARAVAERLKVALDLRVVDAGENVDGDFRLNLWRGDLAGTPLADLMLHVPNDRMLALRNEQIFLTNPYFEQRIAFAYRKGALEGLETMADIAGHPVAVEGASAADLMLLTGEGGRHRDDLRHFKTFEEAARAYLAGETEVLAGTRAGIEAALFAGKAPAGRDVVTEIALAGPVKTRWAIGGAVRTDSRDLAYAVGDALAALASEGRIQEICARYGVTYTAPKGY